MRYEELEPEEREDLFVGESDAWMEGFEAGKAEVIDMVLRPASVLAAESMLGGTFNPDKLRELVQLLMRWTVEL